MRLHPQTWPPPVVPPQRLLSGTEFTRGKGREAWRVAWLAGHRRRCSILNYRRFLMTFLTILTLAPSSRLWTDSLGCRGGQGDLRTCRPLCVATDRYERPVSHEARLSRIFLPSESGPRHPPPPGCDPNATIRGVVGSILCRDLAAHRALQPTALFFFSFSIL
ncbi:hypothetical protein LZ30DRAFT_724841 [Colletotrichum cereale]|nr:hypothetical protein LZ30DRAFT_724841 [Colletotrichum cereale]